MFAAYTNIINETNENLKELHDDYEEFAYVLEKISIVEFQLLNILYTYEEAAKIQLDCDNILISVSKYWDSFLEKATSELKVDIYYINGMLSKLTGSGLYQTINGIYLGYLGNKGQSNP